jgi:putative two-component system response regulator
MHDIGKVAIPDSILLKPGALDAREYAAMQQHTTIGHAILKDSVSTLLQKAAEIALTHHEKFDGSGYPNRLKMQDIPLSGRICAISDVFDALTSVRPYKHAWSVDEAVAEISALAGAHFDPWLAQAFVSVLPEIVRLKEEYSDDTLLVPPELLERAG